MPGGSTELRGCGIVLFLGYLSLSSVLQLLVLQQSGNMLTPAFQRLLAFAHAEARHPRDLHAGLDSEIVRTRASRFAGAG